MPLTTQRTMPCMRDQTFRVRCAMNFHTFPICANRRTSDHLLPLSMAWLIKLALLRFVGHRVYQRAKPLFIGMVVGFFFAQGTSFLIDVCILRGSGRHNA